jgi:hypothetical protein
MVKRIKDFEVYPSEIQDVSFFIVATHLNSILSIIKTLIDEGFLLSQINVMYNKDAISAAILYDYQSSGLTVTWKMKDNASKCHIHHLDDAVCLSHIIEILMTTDGNSQEDNSIPSSKK